jgi:hypothetical protein
MIFPTILTQDLIRGGIAECQSCRFGDHEERYQGPLTQTNPKLTMKTAVPIPDQIKELNALETYILLFCYAELKSSTPP